jgi:uncharacterized protein YjiS (DUF1127 family)
VLPIRHRRFIAVGNKAEKRGTESPVDIDTFTGVVMNTHAISSAPKVELPGELIGPARKRFIEIILEWRRRMRSRSELAALSDLDLKDIGYPAAVAAEVNKPFWRR